MKMNFKTITLILFFLLGLCLVEAQQITPSKTENYIMQVDYLTEHGTSGDKSVSIQYFDGLGRPKQSIQVQATPTGKDLVVPIEYDGFGRQAKDHLPVPTTQTNGAYIQPNGVNGNYYQSQYGENIWFSEKTFEDSPLNRVLSQAAPGNDWAKGSGHEIEFKYATNKHNEVRIYTVSDESISQDHYYPPNSLYKTTTIDENGNKIDEFKDKQGRVVLKVAHNPFSISNDGDFELGSIPISKVNYETYYIYDIYGNLVAVVPPLAAQKSSLTTNQVRALCYLYKYDERNRLVEKKLPGKEKEYMVYDKQDRLVATQDANLRSQGKWLFTKYDQFGRVVYTGIHSNSSNRTTLQTQVNAFKNNNEVRATTVQFTRNNLPVYYTKTAFPTTIDEILSVNYYDSYDNLLDENFTLPSSILGEGNLRKESNELRGMPVVSLLRILGAQQWEKTFTVYDKKSRPVGTYKTNHLGGETKMESQFNFTGLPLMTQTAHKRTANATTVKIEEVFTYDSQLRLTKHTHAVGNAAPQVLALNTYDELGQLKSKKVGGTQNGSDRWQQVDYEYNIRGWLTDINNINALTSREIGLYSDDLFSFKITYNSLYPIGGNTEPLYNGNIAQTLWRAGSDNELRGYNYRYDKVNRLLNAQFYQDKTNPFTGAYGEKLAYDANGNIITLIRTTGDSSGNAISMDELTYAYKDGDKNSNLLLNVTDHATVNGSDGFKDGNTNPNLNDYEYDDNGNMILDRNKGITEIKYNHLNLPTKITWSNTKYISYQYNAAGQKVSKTVRIDADSIKVVDYLDGFQYAGNQLQFFPTAEGYVRVNADKLQSLRTYNYVYNHTDHLGNVRLSYSKDPRTGELEILEENHYYPFGLKHGVYTSPLVKDFILNDMGTDAVPGGGMGEVALINVTKTEYQYKYNGKEWQDELGLNWYDYDARNYDATIGRWMNVDPLAEKFFEDTPYNYALNNPVFFIDPDGMAATYNWDKGKYMDGDKEVSFSDAMASHGMSADGSDCPKCKQYLEKAGNILNNLAENLAPIRPLTPEESAELDERYGKSDGNPLNDLKRTWNAITDIPSDFQESWKSISWGSIKATYLNASPEEKVEMAANFAVILTSLKKGRLDTSAASVLGGGKKISGWVVSKVFNSLDSSIQTKVKNAISNGVVAPTGSQGIIKLTASEAKSTGYTYKIKILGKGGDIRIYGNTNRNGHIVFDKVMRH